MDSPSVGQVREIMDLRTKTQEELSEMCRKIGKHPSGTKTELIARLRLARRKEANRFKALTES